MNHRRLRRAKFTSSHINTQQRRKKRVLPTFEEDRKARTTEKGEWVMCDKPNTLESLDPPLSSMGNISYIKKYIFIHST